MVKNKAILSNVFLYIFQVIKKAENMSPSAQGLCDLWLLSLYDSKWFNVKCKYWEPQESL